MDILIWGGRVLDRRGEIVERPIGLRAGRIVETDAAPVKGCTVWQAHGLLVLPGIVDLHGDAFERQLMPRPGVHFPVDGALLETDRQMIANGITTAYHGLTYSWEPGLRGAEAARAFMDGLEAVCARLRVDTRVHLRWETHNLDAEPEITAWLRDGRVDLLAFNDHVPHIVGQVDRPAKMAAYADRRGIGVDDFHALFAEVRARAEAVPAAIERLAAIARAARVPMASHDDETPEMRQWFAARGTEICEFPVDAATARCAIDEGDAVILGAPNVLRGGSHCGRLAAAEAVRDDLCTVLTSDYYYPSLLTAVFRLVADGVCDLTPAPTPPPSPGRRRPGFATGRPGRRPGRPGGRRRRRPRRWAAAGRYRRPAARRRGPRGPGRRDRPGRRRPGDGGGVGAGVRRTAACAPCAAAGSRARRCWSRC